MLPTFADVEAAAGRLAGIAHQTPLLSGTALDDELGGRVLIKVESLQRTGSFKIRGAYNRLVQLDADQRAAGVVAFSSGNHAQGVAEAARRLGIAACIVMPADAPRAKLDNTRALGAEVITYDRHSQSREAIATALASERGAVLVPSFDDPHIIAGQGTVGLELMQQAAALGQVPEQVLIGCSGGGLIAGSALAIHALAPEARIYCVEPEAYDDHRRSLAAGKRVTHGAAADSICDALLSPLPGVLTFAINQRLLAGGLVVSDDEVRRAMAWAFRYLRLVVEPGGAVGLAALLSGKIEARDCITAIVLTGGNVDAPSYCAAINP